MKKTPKVPKNGSCAHCGGQRGIKTKPQVSEDHPFKSDDKTLKVNAHAALVEQMVKDDPFCTTACAKAYYGYDISRNYLSSVKAKTA